MIKKLIVSFLLCAACAAPAFSLEKAGIPVSLNSSVHSGASYTGVRLHFSNLYALEPLIGFHFMENNSSFRFNIRNLFYLTQIGSLEQYFMGSLRGDFDGNFGIDGRFGLQHNLTGNLDLFGEIGFNLHFDPFQMYNAGGVGVIFYF
jgi:hypothetical protein